MTATVTFNSFTFNGNSGYPVPTVALNTVANRLGGEDGPVNSITDTYTLAGVIFASGYNDIIAKASNLRTVFACDGRLSVQLCGANLCSGMAQVKNFKLDPTDDYWTQTARYEITLEVERSGSSGTTGSGFVSSASNSWEIKTSTEYNFYTELPNASSISPFHEKLPIYEITHTVSAVGKYVPTQSQSNQPACTGDINSKMQQAKTWVEANFSGGRPGILVNNTILYDFNRNISTNIVEGSYSITDTFMIFGSNNPALPPFLETYTVNHNLDETFKRTVTIEGTIKGLATISGSSQPYTAQSLYTDQSGFTNRTINKYNNALSGYRTIEPLLFNRASRAFSGYSPTGSCFSQSQIRNQLSHLHFIPQSSTVTHNPYAGEITYSFIYDNRPSPIIPCAVSETLTVNDTLSHPVIAEIPVLGRRLGPVLQNIGTFSAPTRTVNFEVILPRPSSISGVIFPTNHYNTITGLLENFNPAKINPRGSNFVVSFVKENTEAWNPNEGKFSKSITWVYTKCQGTLADFTNSNLIR